jgi:hypothetical protein
MSWSKVLLSLWQRQHRIKYLSQTADDEYKGYHFPAGTTFLANAWYGGIHSKLHPIPLQPR